MKKGSKIALLIAVLLIAVGATLCNIARGRGEDIGMLIKDGGLSFSSGTVSIGGDQKGYTVCRTGEESFDAAEIRALDLDWVSGSVLVESYDGARVIIREEANKPLSEGQRMRWKLSGGKLSVLFCANGEQQVPEKTLRVQLPKDWEAERISAEATSASVTLKELTVSDELNADTTSGEILAQSCAAGELRLSCTSGGVRAEASAVHGTLRIEASSGEVSVQACACKELKINTTSGRVQGEAVACAAADVDTTSGAVSLLKLAEGCKADVETGSGEVTLSYAGRPGEINVDTASGDVTLIVPRGTELDMDYDSASGRISGELSFSTRGVKAEVDTVSGDLRIEAAG